MNERKENCFFSSSSSSSSSFLEFKANKQSRQYKSVRVIDQNEKNHQKVPRMRGNDVLSLFCVSLGRVPAVYR
jgi:hypothetical protein